MIVGAIVFVLLMMIQICIYCYNIELLSQSFNTLSSCLLEILSIGIFMILGLNLVSKLKEVSQFFQSLFHIPVTGAELLIIFNVIVGIVLCFWLSQACVISVQHALKRKLVVFFVSTALVVLLMGIGIFVILHLSNTVVLKVVAISSGIILIAILEVVLFCFKSKSDSKFDRDYWLWLILLVVLLNAGVK